jgi:hypothetical protein
MKTTILASFIVLGGAVAIYLISSFRNVAVETIKREDLPQRTYEITRWVSDANGMAYIMKDPAQQRPVTVGRGQGKKEPEGLRPSNEYLSAVPGEIRARRIINRKSGQVFAYVLASERLEIEAGFNILKRSVMVSIRDPEDAHHRKMREGP